MISFIIPAFNEAFELGPTLTSVFAAARGLGQPFEVIVVNDASTDATARIARDAGARVVDVQLRKIAAVRNAGARAAQGGVFFFVDADTRISEVVLRAAMATIEAGAVGGGARVGFSETFGWGIRFTTFLFTTLYMSLLGWAAGCFVFVRRDAFQAVGGFDEKLYASEEITLSRALKKQGRFVVLRQEVLTSGRKIRMNSFWQIVPFAFQLLRRGPAFLRHREGMDWWYDGKREKKDPPVP